MSLDKTFLSSLADILPSDALLTCPTECIAYSFDNSHYCGTPSAVLFPDNRKQVANIVKACVKYHVPVIARGRGTGTTGAAIGQAADFVVLSTERLRRIIALSPSDRFITVEPGVTNAEVQAAAKAQGFFFAPDPTSSAYCSIGGNLAVNAGGPRSVKYGATRDNVLACEFVDGRGELISTGAKTSKNAVGFDLTRLLVGSEGSLGIITQATLKLLPLPPHQATVRVIYRDVTSAIAAVNAIMSSRLTPSALEFMDERAIAMIRDYSEVQFPPAAGSVLLINCDGSKSEVAYQLDELAKLTANDGLLEFKHASCSADVARLWKMRKALSPSLKKVAPKKINEDVIVPISQLEYFFGALAQLAERHQLTVVNFGHAGNGNIHVNLMINPNDHEESARAEMCLQDLFSLVVSLEGSLSGEHGTGLAKQAYLSKQLSQAEVQLMHQLKQAFDPYQILNPGKLPALSPA